MLAGDDDRPARARRNFPSLDQTEYLIVWHGIVKARVDRIVRIVEPTFGATINMHDAGANHPGGCLDGSGGSAP